MKLGSLFDGSGGFPLAGTLCGIEPIWASEVEPYPIAVTRERFPKMKHLGDISKINGKLIEPVDIITFGSPCQDLSVAGKRAGLKHEAKGDEETTRSGLFMEAVRIIKEMREATDGMYPRFALWENVPGAFSSNNGEDFRIVCEELIKVVEPTAVMPPVPKRGWAYADCYVGDRWSLAYRVFDAQHWGVPQRRKRIYLVADFRGTSAKEVLFERKGLSGYSAESFRSWQAAPGGSSNCSGATGFDGYNGCLTDDKAATLGVNCGMSTGRNGIVLNDQGGNRMDISYNVTGTLRAEAHHPPCIMEETVALENHPADGRIKIETDGTMQTLTSRMETGGNNVPLLLKIRSGCEGGGKGPLIQSDRSATLACNNDQILFEPHVQDSYQRVTGPLLASGYEKNGTQEAANGMYVIQPFGISSFDSNAMKSSNPHAGIYESKTARTLDTSGGNPACNQGGIAVVTIEGNGARPSHKGDGYKESDIMYTLNATEQHAVAYSMTTGSFTTVNEERVATLMARDYKDPSIVTDYFYSDYNVRRLTPTECARLQGFPDNHGHIEKKDTFTEDEYAFWHKVRNTHEAILGKKTGAYTEQQMIVWYNKLWTDASEYKMWGNGIALPTALYCMQGLSAAIRRDRVKMACKDKVVI